MRRRYLVEKFCGLFSKDGKEVEVFEPVAIFTIRKKAEAECQSRPDEKMKITPLWEDPEPMGD